MTRLIINGTAVRNTSRGGRRYYHGVMRHLGWPGEVEVDTYSGPPMLERLAETIRRGRTDSIYWSPAHRGPLFAANHVVTVLDCINLEHVYRDDWRRPILKGVMGQLLDNAVRIATISETTRVSVLSNFDIPPDKVVAIPGPVVFDDFRPGMSVLEAATQPAGRPYFLMVINALPHKNGARAIRAFLASKAARAGAVLKILGALDADGAAALASAGVKVEQLAGVDDETLMALYRSCQALISPSLSEGLNLPIGEALALGAEVICSDIPVHREFYTGCVHFFDPLDEAALAGVIDAVFDGAPKAANAWVTAPRRGYTQVAADYRRLFNSLEL